MLPSLLNPRAHSASLQVLQYILIPEKLAPPATPATPAPLPRGWSRSYALHDDKQTRTHGLRRIAVSRGVPARQSAL